MAQVISFNRSMAISARPSLGVPCDAWHLIVNVPADVAARVANAALWAGKGPEQFILDMLNATFPPDGGAA